MTSCASFLKASDGLVPRNAEHHVPQTSGQGTPTENDRIGREDGKVGMELLKGRQQMQPREDAIEAVLTRT